MTVQPTPRGPAAGNGPDCPLPAFSDSPPVSGELEMSSHQRQLPLSTKPLSAGLGAKQRKERRKKVLLSDSQGRSQRPYLL